MTFLKNAVHYLIRLLKKTLIFFFSLFEVPFFLLTNPALFKNEIVYLFWHWSFGHAVTGLDHAARLYFPHRVSVVYLPHPKTNVWLSKCFPNMDAFVFKGIFPIQSGMEDVVRYRMLQFFLACLSGITGKFEFVTTNNVYMTLSLAEQTSWKKRGHGFALNTVHDQTGYARLLRDGIGPKPSLPPELVLKCREAIARRHPDFFSRPFATLCLREKGRGGPVSTDIRNPGSQENYREAVSLLVKEGYNVAGTCETEPAVFSGISGYFSLDNVDLPPGLLNIFLLTNAALFVGQLSGTFLLPNTCGIPVVLCDAMPHRYGTFKRSDLVLFKRLRDRKSGKYLSLVEIYRKFHDLAMGEGFAEKDIDVEPNTSEEITDAVRETLALIKGTLSLTADDRLLSDKFSKLFSPDMYIYYQGNRTTLRVLRENRDALMAL